MTITPESGTASTTALVQLQRELRNLHYAVSHDLRAPVRAIAGFAQALREQAGSELDQTALHFLQRIEQSHQQLSAMIDGLLQLSQLSQTQLQLGPVDLSELCATTVAQLQRQHPQHQPQVCIAAHMHAVGDAHLLGVVCTELLKNAWQFTRHRAAARIDISATTQAEGVTLCVRDNGMGLDMRYVERLGVPFQHLQSRTELNGLGLGLAQVLHIITRHGGKLWVEAEAEKYAAFYLSLPSASRR